MEPSAYFLLKADIAEDEGRLGELRARLPFTSPLDAIPWRRAVEATLDLPTVSLSILDMPGTFHWIACVELERGGVVVIRVARLDHPELRRSLAIEGLLSPLLSAHGIPHPRVLAVDTSGTKLGTPFAIFEWLEGRPLSLFDDYDDMMWPSLVEVGSILRHLHQVRLPGAGPLIREEMGGNLPGLRGRFDSWDSFVRCRLPEHVKACLELGKMTPDEARDAVAAFDTAKLESFAPADRLLHGDPSSSNAYVELDGSVQALLDWEDALVGDPVFELASWASFHPERRWPYLFQGYYGAASLPRCDAHRFWLYALRIALARTVARHRLHIADLPGRPPASQRIQRAIEGLDAARRHDA